MARGQRQEGGRKGAGMAVPAFGTAECVLAALQKLSGHDSKGKNEV